VDVWSCGVILYALLCGSLPFDDENIPNLFKKIKGAIYTLPSHLSAGARDLIPRMLYVDPLKRITIPEIRQHSWFATSLPRYLAVPPPDTLTEAQKVDADTLEAVVKTGFDRQMVIDSLRQRLHNKATVAYYLILDNRRKLYTGLEEEALGVGSHNMDIGQHGPQQMVPQQGQQMVGRTSMAIMQQRMVAERNWLLGLHTRQAPADIMAETFRALQSLGIGWKRIQPYNIKCRKVAVVGAGGAAGGGNIVVKFELQVYRVKEERYMLDIQRLDGPLYCFMDLVDRLMSVLRPLETHGRP